MIKNTQDYVKGAAGLTTPLWPLDRFVAVNPYFSFHTQSFDSTVNYYEKIMGAKPYMPLQYYCTAIQNNDIEKDVLKSVLESDKDFKTESLNDFIAAVEKAASSKIKKKVTSLSIAALTSQLHSKDYTQIMIEQISKWAASFFDDGQAIWKLSTYKDTPLYTAWRSEAEIDKTPEILGLSRFRNTVKSLPENPTKCSQFIINELNLSKNEVVTYLHVLQMQISGWSSFIARIPFEKSLYNEADGIMQEFIALLLSWEYAIYKSLKSPRLIKEWQAVRRLLNTTAPHHSIQDQETKRAAILQQALEKTAQKQLIQKINSQVTTHANSAGTEKERPLAQAIFCIDVRSEVIRRHIEAQHKKIETIGFAGFFAFPVAIKPLGHIHSIAHCPVLLPVKESVSETYALENKDAKVTGEKQFFRHIKRAWKSFKMGAISCFSFIGPVGLVFLPKMLADMCCIQLNASQKSETTVTPLDGEKAIDWAYSTLKALSLVDNFSKLVIIAGHGSTTVNNPHRAGLDCGACGGQSGDVNAKLLALTLNNPAVRAGLAEKGVAIPTDTHFIAAIHDTTTDEIKLFNKAALPLSYKEDLIQIEAAFLAAKQTSCLERALRFNDIQKPVQRSKDWSQVRPEWGLAGCTSFIVADRKHSQNLDLGSHSFLHSYDWKLDTDLSVLTLIMTAPMVVTNWINMQYYASTVDNAVFGSGNKTLHNVVGNVGVLEGNGGDIRSGLSIQSLHDGQQWQHQPLRLSVYIQAPAEKISQVILANKMVQDLADNQWLHIFCINDAGVVEKQYKKAGEWTRFKVGVDN